MDMFVVLRFGRDFRQVPFSWGTTRARGHGVKTAGQLERVSFGGVGSPACFVFGGKDFPTPKQPVL